ncbi:hypothetical protein Tco_0236082 [Tanacetum coccineum]
MLNPSLDIGIDSIFNLNTESTSLIDVPVTTIAKPPLFSTTTLPLPPTPLITHLLKTFDTDFSELKQTNQFAAGVSSIPGIIDAYLANKMSEAFKTAKIKKTVNEQLKAKVLTRSSNESKTSHTVAANLSELELKKILIDKMESNKSIHRSDEQKNLYKALVDAYKRSKRRRAGKEPKSTSAPKEKTSKITGKSTKGSKSHQKSADESAQAEDPMHTIKDLGEPTHQEFEIGVIEDQPVAETSYFPDWFQKPDKLPSPDHDWNKTLPAVHESTQPWLSNLAWKEDPREFFDELMDTPLDFSAFVMNRLNVDTLTLELLASPTFELMKGTCKSLVELEYFFKEVYKATMEKQDWNNPEGQQYPHDLESTCDVYIRRRIIAVTKLQIVEWHGYKHLDWITIRKLTSLNVEERLAFSVSLRMFTRSIVIQRRVEDLQLGVESYQKKINITKLDTYRFDLKRREAYSTYSNPRGFIYQNKDKKNKLMRVDKLHKFSDGTLNDSDN